MATNRKPLLQFRTSEKGLQWIEDTRNRFGLTRSELVRYALSYAATTPAGFMKHIRAQQAHHKETP